MFNGLADMFGFGRFGGCQYAGIEVLEGFKRLKKFQGFKRFGTCLSAGV
jgi:hypothetical protein